MMNNDGCDVLYFPADEKATAEGCRDLVVSVSMASAPGNARNGR
jgi:hypothetical protein